MTRLRARCGFTLIEILVVLVIISLASGIALLAFGDFGAARRIKVAAEQLSSYVKLLQQRAILESNTFGLRVESGGYDTWRFNQGKWQSMPANGLFHWHSFPKNTVIFLHVKHKNMSNTPDIILNPSGNMTEFELDFGTDKQSVLLTLTGQHNGTLSLTDLEKK